MSRTRSITVVSLLLALLTACASAPPKPSVDFDVEHDFAQDKNIGFYALSGGVTGSNPMQMTDFQKDRIKEALGNALEGKGYNLVDSAKMLIC